MVIDDDEDNGLEMPDEIARYDFRLRVGYIKCGILNELYQQV